MSTPYILHVYEHCPFCVKARMIFGLKKIPYERRIFLNDDVDGPVSMVGRKIVPILEENGRFMAESMDIVAHIDAIGSPVLTGPVRPEIADWIHASAKPLYRLFLPRAASAPLPEFDTTSARAGFIRRKEPGVGSFSALLEDGTAELAELNGHLERLAPMIRSPEAVNGTLSTDDIHLFAQLHSLSIIKGVRYPLEVEAYRQSMSELSNVGLFDGFAA
ncbi:glutaredoxin 2 [Gluconobacter morbifer]|uniref:Glutaredoxin 2 n=1 Tax=Gluconobacter morbifer G707 TaxID=1088869 RepID=G6XMN1_9PROT|nr:glutaredoxin 2 [Gluconobacter morbifer]EHH66930.1 glutaredoxin 2 [Gluconobacter morbifer G707]